MNNSWSINGETQVYGIIGDPVSHSLSPLMQTAAFQELGLNAAYLPFLISEKNLPSTLKAFSVIGLRGFNVTSPYKEKIVPFLDQLSAEAQMLQSVNTVQKIDNIWKGHNTDGSGFVNWLSESKITVSGKNILLIGAGGTGKSIALALAAQNIGALDIINRTRSKAEKTIDIIKRIAPDLPARINPADNVSHDLLINTVSTRGDKERSPVSENLIKNSRIIVDILYHPRQTMLLKKAEKLGKPCFNGLGMLIRQGAEAFEIWTGRKAPIELMKKIL